MAVGGGRSEAGPGAGAVVRRPGRTRGRGRPASLVPVPCGSCPGEGAARQVLGRDFLHFYLRAPMGVSYSLIKNILTSMISLFFFSGRLPTLL